MKRIYSIDVTRGIVMIIMALDHVRDMMHASSITRNPTDLATTTPILFFTRWITHLCAPTFVFLAGTSAYLSFKSKYNLPQSRSFLLKRGLWLILLEFSVVNLGLFFDPGFHNLLFEVIGAIGFGFIILSLLLRLPAKTIGIAGLAIIFLHNLIFLIEGGQGSRIMRVLTPFFAPGAFPLLPEHVFIMGYPPIPWLGIMLTGFAAGKLFELPEGKRAGLFLKTGISALLFFVILRFINIYGDPAAWSAQKSPSYTFLSFMNITKYPPSLLFCSVTLGVMFLILAAVEQAKNRITDIAYVYGKVPLFYFIVHFYLIHAVLILLLFLQGFHWADLNFVSGTFGRPKAQSGLPLWAVYLVWIAVVAILYKPCMSYNRYKIKHTYRWLKYM